MIRLHVLGSFELRSSDGHELRSVLAQPKRAALLAYLALARPRGFHRRDSLLPLFWPDFSQNRARQALRQAVHFLRRALGDGVVSSRGDEELALNSELVWCDAVAFETAVEEDPRAALECYRGELLPGFFVTGADDFERWLEETRASLHRRAADAAAQLASRDGSNEVDPSALHWARRAAALAPDDEHALRRLLERLVRAGDRGGAVRTYREFAERLKRDLDVDPTAQTQSFAASLFGPEHAASTDAGSVRGGAATTTSNDRVVTASSFAATVPGRLAESPRPCANGILVLPFANMSPDPDSDYFADGLTEELITDLSQVRALRVISRTSAMRLKGCAKDAPTIAQELGVRYVLDGSVRKAGRTIRITAQLVDALADAPLWAEKFGGSDEDVFTLQERLSRQIVSALRITLTPSESERIAEHPVRDPRAYECYLRARQKILRFSASDLDDAVALLGEGLRILGENGLLLGAMGLVYVFYVHWGVRPDPRYLEEAERYAKALLRLDAVSPQGHALLGAIHMKRANLQEAVWCLKRAVEQDPVNFEALLWLLYCYLTAGQPGAARPVVERLLEVDPLTPINHAAYGWLYWCEGRIEEALPHYRRGYELDPVSPVMRWLHGWSLAQSGRRGEAIAVLSAFAKDASDTVFGELASALSCALEGKPAAAQPAAGSQLLIAAHQDEGLAHFLTEVFALSGNHDESLRWLERAIERGYLNFPVISGRDALYGHLRDDPRFARLLETVRRRWEAFNV
jgi:TolB-like protein/DNA-binding SARP family transcriptional activator/TPR repeat protein